MYIRKAVIDKYICYPERNDPTARETRDIELQYLEKTQHIFSELTLDEGQLIRKDVLAGSRHHLGQTGTIQQVERQGES